MKRLNEIELKNINGGGIGWGIIIGSIISFIFGLIDGYVSPLPCKK